MAHGAWRVEWKWPLRLAPLRFVQALYLADSLMDATPLTWLDFRRVPLFINFHPSTCAGSGGPSLWFHKLTLLNMPNVVAKLKDPGAGGTVQYGAAAQRLNVQVLDAAQGWGTDQVLPFAQLATDRCTHTHVCTCMHGTMPRLLRMHA